MLFVFCADALSLKDVEKLSAAATLEKYPDAHIVGTSDGYVKEEGMDALVEKINAYLAEKNA